MNRTKVSEITRLEVPPSLRIRFHEFEKDPLDFWESIVQSLPRYSGRESEDRARAFLEGAVQLGSNIEKQHTRRRFVAVAAYNLFRRVSDDIRRSCLQLQPREISRSRGAAKIRERCPQVWGHNLTRAKTQVLLPGAKRWHYNQ